MDKVEDKEAVSKRLKHTGNLSILGKSRFITTLTNSQPIWVKTLNKNNFWNVQVVYVLPDILQLFNKSIKEEEKEKSQKILKNMTCQILVIHSNMSPTSPWTEGKWWLL